MMFPIFLTLSQIPMVSVLGIEFGIGYDKTKS